MENNKWLQTYLYIWVGQFLSMLSSYAVQFAIIIWLSLECQSAQVLAYAAIAGMLPQAIIGPFAGVYIDRWDRKRTMMLADSFIAGCALIMVYVLRSDTIHLPLIYLLLGLRSIGNAFHSPALQAVAPLIVPKDQLLRVAGINQVIQSITGIAGPAIGTLAITYLSISKVIYLDVFGALFAVISLVFVHIPSVVTKKKTSIFKVAGDLREGLNAVLDSRGLSFLFLYAMAITFFTMPVAIMFPLLTIEHYLGGKWEMGLVEVIWGVGMLFGGAALGLFKLRSSKVVVINLMYLLMGLTFIVSGILSPQHFLWFVVATAIGGISMAIFAACFNTILQIEVAPDKLGRVFSLYYSLAILPSTIGLLFAGLIAEKIGITNTFIISGGLVMLTGLLAFGTPALKRLRQ
ncbi:MAG TPA: macrolide efflux MFS transporter Mef(C) [Marinilabiliaceae bacterium]|nr:macrolide efflux MFS transporter Mef(C) [Marinilabiliaceae bacterium]